MQLSDRVWNTTRTGFKVHAFQYGTAVCRYSIKEGAAPAHAHSTARRWVLDTPGLSFCTDCEYRFSFLVRETEEAAGRVGADHAEALEMNAEFDYALRSAEERARIALAVDAQDAEQACICPEFGSNPSDQDIDHHIVCPLRATEQKETTPMGIKDGPLTERQTQIIELASSGLRQNEIAKEIDTSYPVVRMEVNAVIHKFGADSSGQVYALYATARAYQEAADLLDKASRAHPERDGVAEDHADHVLAGLAEILRERAERLLPK